MSKNPPNFLDIHNDEKDIKTLLNEICLNNNYKEKITNNLKSINNIYQNCFLKIEDENNLKNEIRRIIVQPKSNNLYIIASMIRVYELLYQISPRKIQIISLLICLLNENEKGLIEEIKTGEGKTLVISFLAVIYCIQGKKVDILTSSSVLASRDSLSLEQFYSFYNLKCDFCKDDKNNKSNQNNYECYNSDICYGDSVNFEGDILRSEFLGQIGRGKRPFDCIIVDEIDNLCIDNLKNQTELLDNFPGYKFLEYFYLFIYYNLQCIVKQTQNFNKDDKIKRMEIIKKLDKMTRNFLIENRKRNDINKILYPEHLEDFIENRINHWCNSAYIAMFEFELNKNYIFSKDEFNNKIIEPIDFSNTGNVQKNSVWSGLHQFLEIKHGLRLTEENLNSCFMSNLTFFNLYKEINGFTGTLGSKKTQEAIKEIYHIDLIKIPTFKASKLEKYINLNLKNMEELKLNLSEIIKEIAIKNNRAILFIFEYISEAKNMHDFFKLNLVNNGLNFILYVRNDFKEESEFLKKPIFPGTIIFSTNLAGRGTDIKISEQLEKNGGLHVVVTFMPKNKRIEDQAFGRAARKGEKGSAQIIMISKETYEKNISIQNIKEEDDFNFLIGYFTPKMNLFYRYFCEFCNNLKKIQSQKVSEYLLEDIREQWSFFVFNNNNFEKKVNCHHKNDYYKIFMLEQKIIESEFNDFNLKIFSNKIKDCKYKNPFLLIKTFTTLDLFDKAIIISKNMSLGAYYLRAYFLIKEKLKNYQKDSLSDLKMLKNLSEKLLNQFDIYLKVVVEIKKNQLNYFPYLTYQINEKKQIMKKFQNNFEININIIDSAFKTTKEKYPYFADNDILNALEFSIRKEIKNLNDLDIPINKDIDEYFIDYGLCILYNIEIKNAIQCEII